MNCERYYVLSSLAKEALDEWSLLTNGCPYSVTRKLTIEPQTQYEYQSRVIEIAGTPLGKSLDVGSLIAV